MDVDEIRGHLNDLIAVSRDGEEGYRQAAEHVSNSELRSLFAASAKQRAGFVHELQQEVERLGGNAAQDGTLAAVMHRGWLDLKAALTGGDAHAVVSACETGDDRAAAAYESVVNRDITGHPRALVEKQWHAIVEAHRHLVRLKQETTGPRYADDVEGKR